jgi:hypothetical protein
MQVNRANKLLCNCLGSEQQSVYIHASKGAIGRLCIFSPQVSSNYLRKKLGEWVRICERFLNGLFALFIAACRLL